MSELKEQVEKAAKEYGETQYKTEGWNGYEADNYIAGATQSPLLVKALYELDRAHIRMEILVGRMRGCHEVTGQHELLSESDSYASATGEAIKEIREAQESLK